MSYAALMAETAVLSRRCFEYRLRVNMREAVETSSLSSLERKALIDLIERTRKELASTCRVNLVQDWLDDMDLLLDKAAGIQ